MPICKYFIRRFFRIAPAYYFILLTVMFLNGKGVPDYTDPGQTSLTWPDLIAHLFFINSFFPYYSNDFLGVEWSISTEVLFYSLLLFYKCLCPNFFWVEISKGIFRFDFLGFLVADSLFV